MRTALVIIAAVIVLTMAAIAAAIVLGAAPAPPPLASLNAADAAIAAGLADYPAAETYTARDGTRLALRRYQGARGAGLVVLVHGSSGSARAVHRAAKALAAAGMTVIAPDIRGHGDSGPHGDIAFVGQLDDDLADLVAMLDRRYPGARRLLAGHSSGGGFVLRIAGGKYACAFDAYLSLSPYLNYRSPTVRPGAGGWSRAFTPRIAALSVLDRFGIHNLDGLPTLAFALPPGTDPTRTSAYSFRLMANFGLDLNAWKSTISRIDKPTIVLVGGRDELFYPLQFKPVLTALQPAIVVKLIEGPNHMGMVLDDAGLAAITANAKALLAAAPATPHCTP